MSINRVFDDYKFTRTYIGGSKKNEKQKFDEIQFNEENMDWIKYRSLLMNYFDDKLNVIFSWKILLKNISIILLIIGIISFFYNTNLFIIPLVFSVISFISYLRLKNKQRKEVGGYDLCMTITNQEIRNRIKTK